MSAFIKIHGVWIWMSHNFPVFLSRTVSSFILAWDKLVWHTHYMQYSLSLCDLRQIMCNEKTTKKWEKWQKCISIKLKITDCPVWCPSPYSWSVRILDNLIFCCCCAPTLRSSIFFFSFGQLQADSNSAASKMCCCWYALKACSKLYWIFVSTKGSALRGFACVIFYTQTHHTLPA